MKRRTEDPNYKFMLLQRRTNWKFMLLQRRTNWKFMLLQRRTNYKFMLLQRRTNWKFMLLQRRTNWKFMLLQRRTNWKFMLLQRRKFNRTIVGARSPRPLGLPLTPISIRVYQSTASILIIVEPVIIWHTRRDPHGLGDPAPTSVSCGIPAECH